MNDAEKEALVDEVLTRINEMSDEDKKQRSVENRKILANLSTYFTEKLKEYDRHHPYNAKGQSVDGPHLWRAYYQIRAIIPWFIGVRYSNMDNWDTFYKENPGAKRRETYITVANQMLEEDADLAFAIGKKLVDTLFEYLEPNSWDEKEAAAERTKKSRRSPMTKIRGWK